MKRSSVASREFASQRSPAMPTELEERGKGRGEGEGEGEGRGVAGVMKRMVKWGGC